MTSKAVSCKLKALGFRYDEDETGKFDGFRWSGSVVPLFPMKIDGDDFSGFRVCGNTRKEMDEMALNDALQVLDIIS